MRRAEEIIAGELGVVPELRPIFEALVTVRHEIDAAPGPRTPLRSVRP